MGKPDLPPCRWCGYKFVPLPAWNAFKAVFAIDGETYRVTSYGRTNKGTAFNAHYNDGVLAEKLSEPGTCFDFSAKDMIQAVFVRQE